MAAPSTAAQQSEEGARLSLAPTKTQREERLSKAQSGAGNSKISTPSIPSISPRLGEDGHRGRQS